MPKTRTLGARTHGIDGYLPITGRVPSEFQWPREDPCYCLACNGEPDSVRFPVVVGRAAAKEKDDVLGVS